ncbi:nucleotidyltransferase domain-containing protein, partial [Spirulina sp. 06S082]|uniref:nucleotidyltransferase domain-containing protein n=1 Tax=Spirulina sp. 06S082 TaxID=3110248 RepID=UPI002B1ED0BA
MLNQDFKEFIELLNKHDVKYLVIGGYAVAVHGHPRYTKDIDIWIKMSTENAEKIVKVLTEFGFGSLGLSLNDFTCPNQIIQLGYPPARIDIITTPDGVDFETCYQTKMQVELSNILVDFIDLEILKQNKKASGRL